MRNRSLISILLWAVGWIGAAITAMVPVGQASDRYGTISGRVFDGYSDHRVVFSNVVVDGTTFGAMARQGGAFTIRYVPVGLYSLTATNVNFEAGMAMNVRVGPDSLTLVDFRLKRRRDFNPDYYHGGVTIKPVIVPRASSDGELPPPREPLKPSVSSSPLSFETSVRYISVRDGWVDVCVASNTRGPEWYRFDPQGRQQIGLTVDPDRQVGFGDTPELLETTDADDFVHSEVKSRDKEVHEAVCKLNVGNRVSLTVQGQHVVRVSLSQ